MDLNAYLAENRITKKSFAAAIGTRADYLSRMIYGKRRFSKRIAERIEEETKGKVTYFSLRGEKKSRIKKD